MEGVKVWERIRKRSYGMSMKRSKGKNSGGRRKRSAERSRSGRRNELISSGRAAYLRAT